MNFFRGLLPGPGRRDGDAASPGDAHPRPTDQLPTTEDAVVYWRDLDDGVLERLLGPLADDLAVSTLLDHCGRTNDMSARDWEAICRRLVAAAPDAAAALSTVARREEPLPAVRNSACFRMESLVIGVIRALPHLDAATAVPLLARVADQCGRPRLHPGHELVARAAIRGLGTVGAGTADSGVDPAAAELALPPLRRLKAESPSQPLRKAAATQLDRVLRTLRSHPGDDVPHQPGETFELNQHGERRLDLAGFTATIRVHLGGRVTVTYTDPQGVTQDSAPHIPRRHRGDGVQAATDLAAKIRAAVRTERAQLKQDMESGREQDASTWMSQHLDHPIGGALAASIVWQQSTDGGTSWSNGVPARAPDDGRWQLRTVRDDRVEIGPTGRVRVMGARKGTSGAGKAWTRRLRRWGIVQAVQQFL